MAANSLSAFTNIAIKDVIGKQVSHEFKISDLSYNNVCLIEELGCLLAKIGPKVLAWHDKKGGVFLDQKPGSECLFIRGINASINGRFAQEKYAFRKIPVVSVGGSGSSDSRSSDSESNQNDNVEYLKQKIKLLESRIEKLEKFCNIK